MTFDPAVTPIPRPPARVAVLSALTVSVLTSLLVILPQLPRPVAQAQEAGPGETPRMVLLLMDAPDRGRVEEMLQLELSARGLGVLGLDAPGGQTALARAAAAQEAARFAGAEAALWVESAPADRGEGATLRAVTPEGADASRFAPLPAPVDEVDPRTFAVVAGSLVDELVSPPEAPIRVRVQVSVDAPGRDVDVSTIVPEVEVTDGSGASVATTVEIGSGDGDGALTPPPAPPTPPEAAPVVVAVAPEPPTDPVASAGPTTAPSGDEAPVEDGEHPTVALGGDVFPFLGTSARYRGREIRNTSLNLLGGYHYGVEGWELSAGFNLTTGFVHGAQIAPVANLNLGELRGVQAAAGFNITGADANGAQVAAGFNYVGGPLSGAQVAAGANIAGGDIDGSQVAAGVNLAFGQVRGAQVAGGLNLATGGVDGVQVAPVNVATGEVDGVQVGVINVSRKADFALGLVNVFYGGRTHLEISGDESGFIEARLKHGGDHFHYIYSLGGRGGFSNEGAQGSFGIGLGGHVPVGDALFVDIELLSRGLVGSHGSGTEDPGEIVTNDDGVRSLTTARLAVGVRVLPKIALLGGLTYNVFVDPGGGDDGTSYGLFGNRDLGGGVRGWPGFTLGVQFF